MKNKFIIFVIFSFLYSSETMIINHNCIDITMIPDSAINNAKQQLHIAYGHTSHGSQIVSGMKGLIGFANNGGKGLNLPDNIFKFNNGGADGALDLHDNAMAKDVGYYPSWINETKAYLDDPQNSEVNVIMWSWCGQVDDKYKSGRLWSEYLGPMNQLEKEYLDVTFVYMTGHVDISDDTYNKAANDSIRSYCLNNGKVLYDFADIERWDPDGYYYKYVDDDCDYYNSNYQKIGNWAMDWQDNHTEGIDWYNCSSAHSQPLNANQKAYAVWWMFARLVGWEADSNIIIDEREKNLQTFTLKQNYPNPFNSYTSIEYELFRDRHITLTIYDLSGNQIEILVNEEQGSNDYSINWNAKGLGTGIYFYKIQTKNFSNTKKMMLVK